MPEPQAQLLELRAQIKFLEEEAAMLRRRLDDQTPARTRALEERLIEAKSQLSSAASQNGKLADTLREAREQIVALKQQVEKLSAPPSGYGIFLQIIEDDVVEIFSQGRKLRVHASPDLDASTLVRGQEVVLNEALNIIEAASFELTGDVMTIKERIDEDRLLVIGHTDDELVVRLAEPLRDAPLRAGDTVLVDTRSGWAMERL